jgi:hypothetical protein
MLVFGTASQGKGGYAGLTALAERCLLYRQEILGKLVLSSDSAGPGSVDIYISKDGAFHDL